MAASPKDVLCFIGRSARRIAITVVGGVFVLGGLAMLVLPGPAIIVLPIGFAILGLEYAWAARALDRTKDLADKGGKLAKGAVRRVTRRGQKQPQPPPPPYR